MIKILYEGEHIIIDEGSLSGYEGCEVLGTVEEEEAQDCPYRLVSREHLTSVHAQKAIESALILSGYELTHGLLAEEANALGIDLLELAQIVQEKRKAEREYEIERRVVKRGDSA